MRSFDTVHTAGLLHDIGKFAFPDRILRASGGLTDEDYTIVRAHPEHGADLVRSVEGLEEIASIILAHHERIDGHGYPHGLSGNEIPALSRMISVSDMYDVMTSRDTYRHPVSTEDAIAELRRVSGTQLDARFVELFIGVLESGGVGFAHAEDADFEAELAMESRVRELARATGDAIRPGPDRAGARRAYPPDRSGADPARAVPRRVRAVPVPRGARPSQRHRAADRARVPGRHAGVRRADGDALGSGLDPRPARPDARRQGGVQRRAGGRDDRRPGGRGARGVVVQPLDRAAHRRRLVLRGPGRDRARSGAGAPRGGPRRVRPTSARRRAVASARASSTSRATRRCGP
jgi:hypothetical protein